MILPTTCLTCGYCPVESLGALLTERLAAMESTNDALWTSYERVLKARNRSTETIASYLKAVRELDRYVGKDLSTLSKVDIQDYLNHRLTQISATTVAIRFRSLRALYSWMLSEEIVVRSPMHGLHEPKAPDVPPMVLTDDELKKLIETTSGRTFECRRDEAVIRIMCEPGGARLGEIAGLSMGCVDLKHDLIRLHGKGNKVRSIPFGAKTGTSLDRYLRMRSKHPERHATGLWLGKRGVVTPSGIAQLLGRRAIAAGIGHIHPHQLRHTSAHAWLDSGGSEGDAMLLFGWTSADMPRRYGRAAGITRATRAARRASLGDRL